MKARFLGNHRSEAGRDLGWEDGRVEPVWRRVNRHLDHPKVLNRLERVLTGEIITPLPRRKSETSPGKMSPTDVPANT